MNLLKIERELLEGAIIREPVGDEKGILGGCTRLVLG